MMRLWLRALGMDMLTRGSYARRSPQRGIDLSPWAMTCNAAASTSYATQHTQSAAYQAFAKHSHYAPTMPPITEEGLNRLVAFFREQDTVMVITGAGCSTESGIPDYRGPRGAYSTGFVPMTHQQFMASEATRRRYWARSFAGWERFTSVRANCAHEGIARLQQRGWITRLVTQNVDRLHQQAGADDILELHGTTHIVCCMQCTWTGSRFKFQEELIGLNPWFVQPELRLSKRSGQQRTHETVIQRPDGDVELSEVDERFQLPVCPECGHFLKPNVVFFGDGVPSSKAQAALNAVQECDGMLIVGSSVSTYSVFRLVKAAHSVGKFVAAVNVGGTRADDLLSFKVEALVGEAMMRLACHSALLLPRPG